MLYRNAILMAPWILAGIVIVPAYADLIYRSRGTVRVAEGGTDTGFATYDDGVMAEPGTFRSLSLNAGPTGSAANGSSSFIFSQRKEGLNEIFTWTTTLQRESALEGTFISAEMILNVASTDSLSYTFTAQWDGLSTYGSPYYLATGQGSGYVSFINERNVVESQSGTIGEGTISAGSWNLLISNYIHSGSFGPRPDGLNYPAETATGIYTLTISHITAVPEPSSIAYGAVISCLVIVNRLRSKRTQSEK